MFSFEIALAAELPDGVSFSDFGDVVIGSSDSGIATFNIDPPDGAVGYPYTYFNSYAYYATGVSGSGYTVSSDFTDGYAVCSLSKSSNFALRVYNPESNINIYKNTPFYFWIDMYITVDGTTPLALGLVNTLSFTIGSRNINSSFDSTYGASVSLAPSDILSYDQDTGHFVGYLFFEEGIPKDASAAAGCEPTDSTLWLGIVNGGYHVKLSQVFFAAEPDVFTPPSIGSGTEDPDESTPPTFEDQVLEDLDNIQANQQDQTQQITDAVQQQTDTMLSEDEETGLIGKIAKKLKELFIPSDEYFSDLWERLNTFFSERFGFLWFPFEYTISLIDRLMDLEDTDPTIAIPRLAFGDFELIPAQTYTFDFVAEEPWSSIHGYYLLAIDAAMILAFVGLLRSKLQEVMNR